MNTIVKKIISTVTAAALLGTAAVFDVPGMMAETVGGETIGDHNHGVCGDPDCTDSGHEKITDWQAISSANGFTSILSGNYYLTNDVTLSNVNIGSDVKLCLNGNTISGDGTGSIFTVSGGSLTLCDCKGNGKITGGKADRGGGVNVSSGTFVVMYGGTISDNTATSTRYGGGGVYVDSGGSFTMYGGAISDNELDGTSSTSGGGVYNAGTFIMTGGTISDNKANSYSGGVKNNGTFIMSGGTISGNTAQSQGGGVYNSSSGIFEMSGGAISGNTATNSWGGGVYNVDGTFKMSGGAISGNTAGTQGGGVCNMWSGSGGIFEMSGGEISGNKAASGGGVYHNGKTMTLNGSVSIVSNTKTDGTANNVYLYNNKKITIEEGFTALSPIGITTGKAPTCAVPVAVAAGKVSEETTESFKLDAEAEGQSIVFKDNMIQLTVEHKPETYPEVPPTCTDTGLTEGERCSVCDTVLTGQKTIEALGHEWGDEYQHDEEQHWQVCGREGCGTESDRQGHSWDEGTETKPATEDAEGEMTYKCAACGAEKTEPTAKLSHTHTYSDDWSSDENGHWHEAACGHDEKSGAGEHDFGAPAITPSTCTEAGSEVYVCQICQYEKKVALPLSEHTFDGGEWASDENYHWRECTVCKAHDSGEAHNWDEGEVITEPTEDSEGVKTFTCAVCSQTKTESIPKSEHTHTYSDAWSSDENGHWHEAACGHDEKSGAGEHDFGEPAITPSTCTEAGSEVYVCQTCQYEKKVTLPLSEHTFDGGEWVSDENNHWKVCTACHTAKSEEAEHTWDNGTVTKQPADDEPGEKKFECTVCGKIKTEVISAAGDTEKPENPDKPDNPENPEKPGDPSDPENPGEPSDPEKPDEPSDPEKPGDPSDPENPSNPEKPGDTDKGNISTEVQPGENVPDTELETPLDELIEAVLTPEERELAEEGVEIKIVLTVEDGTSSVSEEDKAKAETAVNGIPDCKLGQYLEINLVKIIGNNQEKVTETGAPITVVFTVPEELRAKWRTYSVIRVHNGETAVLPDLDSSENTVTIETDKFSTYVLAYTDRANVTPPGGNKPGGGNFTVPDVSGSQGSEPEPSESGTSGSGNSEPAESETAVSSGTPLDSDNTPSDNNGTPSESGGTLEGGAGLPGAETSTNNDSGTDSGNVTASADNGSLMPGESAANETNDGNPSTGIAVSFIPLTAAIAILTAAVKRKKK